MRVRVILLALSLSVISQIHAQTITIEIRNELPTTISGIRQGEEVATKSIVASDKFERLTFPIEDLTKLIRLRISGKSKFQIKSIILNLNAKSEIRIEGSEVRAIRLCP